ncbi:MAG: deoxyribose-phosphate aldolase [Eubacteriales bacterium]|nr:deoxyribose-phosphate aldolase [Eubacteriales bacterium]
MGLNERLEHTMLKADATEEMILRYCEEAKQHRFRMVMVNGCHVKTVAGALAETDVLTGCVVGFPLGQMTSVMKAAEAAGAANDGARDIDMVMNIGAAKAGRWDVVTADIRAVVDAVPNDCVVKVIIETCLLTDEEKRRAVACIVEGGADYVKTSTGFSTGGATEADVRLLREAAGGRLKVKASGGIRTKEQAEALIAAGADTLGVGNAVLLI